MKKAAILILLLILANSHLSAQRSWFKINSPISGRHRAINFLSEDSGYVMGDSALYFSSDGGVTWKKRKLPTAYVRSMHFINIDTGTVKTLSGKIFHTVDGCNSWIENSFPGFDTLDVDLLAFRFAQQSEFGVLANICHKCSQGGLIPYTTNGGVDWYLRKSDFLLGNRAWDFIFRSPQVGIGIFDDGFSRPTFASTSDSGNNWTKSDSGLLKSNYSLSTIAYLQNGSWISTIENNPNESYIYRSVDDGDSWLHIFTVNREISSTVFYDNVGYAAVGIAIYSTSDYGATWIQDIFSENGFPYSFSVPSKDVAYYITDSTIFKTNRESSVEPNKSINDPNSLTTVITTSYLYLKFDLIPYVETVEIYDAIGRQVSSTQLPAEATSYRIDISNYATGMYLAKLRGKMYKFLKVGS